MLRKALFPIFCLLFSIVTHAQEIPVGKCQMNILVTDHDDIPETNSKITVKNDEGTFKEDVVTDVDGKATVLLDQKNTYKFRILPSDWRRLL